MARHGMAVPGAEPPGLIEAARTADDRGAGHGAGHAGMERSSISQAWSSTCQAMRRARKRRHPFSTSRSPDEGRESTSTISARRSSMAAVSSIAGGFRRMPSLRAYPASAWTTCSTILSRSRPPPRSLAELGRRAGHDVREHVPRRSEQRRLLLRLGRRQPPAVGRRGALGYAEVRARRTAELLDHLEVIGRSGIERHPGPVGDCALGVRPAFPGPRRPSCPSGTSPASRALRERPSRPISRYTSTGLGED